MSDIHVGERLSYAIRGNGPAGEGQEQAGTDRAAPEKALHAGLEALLSQGMGQA